MFKNFRLIGKIGFLLIVIGLFLPLTYTIGRQYLASPINAITLANMAFDSTIPGIRLEFGVFAYALLLSALAGVVLGVLLFLKVNIPTSVDRLLLVLTVVTAAISYVIISREFLAFAMYIIIVGWVFALVTQLFALDMERKKVVLIKRNWQLYVIFLLPLIWFILFRYWPMLGVQIAFKDFRMGDTILSARWIGLGNFTRFFNHHLFWVLIRNTLSLTIYQLVAGFPIPIIFALALNTTYRTKMKKTVQYITYMPYFISTVVMVGILMQLMNPRIGVINNIIAALGFDRIDFMANPDLFASVYVWSGIWQNFGWNSIIYLAALSGVSPELHESAMIDGASRFKRILHIDIPGILPTITILLILNFGSMMSVGFEKVFLMQNNLNLPVSQVISTYVYTIGLRNMPPEFSFGTAIDLFNSVISITLIIIVNNVARKLSETSLW